MDKIFLGRYQCFSIFIADTDVFVLLRQYLFVMRQNNHSWRQNNHSWSYFAFSQTFSNYGGKTLLCIFFFRSHKQKI